MLSSSVLADLSFMLNLTIEFGMSRETWLLMLNSSKIIRDTELLFRTIRLINQKSKALTNGIKFTCSKRTNIKHKAFMVVSDVGTEVKAEENHNH